MKNLFKGYINGYLNGLNQLYRKSDDPDIFVMLVVIYIEIFLILGISIIFHFRLPTTEEFGNKWIVRLVAGLTMVAINRYIFGIRESVYSEYTPFSRGVTLLITIGYFIASLLFIFLSSKNHFIQ
jgi:hypothetical protein